MKAVDALLDYMNEKNRILEACEALLTKVAATHPDLRVRQQAENLVVVSKEHRKADDKEPAQ